MVKYKKLIRLASTVQC